MRMRVSKTPEGNVVVLKIGRRFDISSHDMFSKACHLADDPATCNIIIDLDNTRHLHDFGLALLLMLYRHTARLKRGVSLINCHPRILGRLSNARLQPQ